jgi:hypothetical protein
MKRHTLWQKHRSRLVKGGGLAALLLAIYPFYDTWMTVHNQPRIIQDAGDRSIDIQDLYFKLDQQQKEIDQLTNKLK